MCYELCYLPYVSAVFILTYYVISQVHNALCPRWSGLKKILTCFKGLLTLFVGNFQKDFSRFTI